MNRMGYVGCLTCASAQLCLFVFDKIIKFLTKFAYVTIATDGASFCQAHTTMTSPPSPATSSSLLSYFCPGTHRHDLPHHRPLVGVGRLSPSLPGRPPFLVSFA